MVEIAALQPTPDVCMRPGYGPWQQLASPYQLGMERVGIGPARFNQWAPAERASSMAIMVHRTQFDDLPAHIRDDIAQIAPEGRVPKRWFEGLTIEQRVSLLALRAKLDQTHTLDIVGRITWMGDQGNMLFEPRLSEAGTRAHLQRKGFGDWWGASSEGKWGVRSRYEGAELHFRCLSSGSMNVHIDLANPGDRHGHGDRGVMAELPGAIQHLVDDLRGWNENHNTMNIVRALLKSGVDPLK